MAKSVSPDWAGAVAKIVKTQNKAPVSDPLAFLSSIGKGRRMISFSKKETIFAQGDDMDGLFFIQTGKVRLSVVSDDGREAVLGILGVGDFFGEGGLAGQLLRMSRRQWMERTLSPKPSNASRISSSWTSLAGPTANRVGMYSAWWMAFSPPLS